MEELDEFDRLSRGLAAGFGPDESTIAPQGTGTAGGLAPRSLADAFGKYEIQGELARGGVGVILRAHDRDLGRDVAVKMLRERYRNNPALLQRFVEEAQIGGQLEHPGIVPVYELGVTDDCPYFAMKLVQGRTLAELFAERKDHTEHFRRYLTTFEQVCQTVAYAHSRGVIHRDLKPANIMVGAFGEVQVMDWGMGKVLGDIPTNDGDTDIIETIRSLGTDADGSHSVMGSVMGTPAYMPPEQARGEVHRMNEGSDVFALGAILCELLTGAPPYAGERAKIFVAAKSCDLREATARLDAAGVAETLVTLTRDCLQEDIAQRPRTAKEVAERMHRHLASVEQRAEDARVVAATERTQATAARKAQRLTLALASLIVFGILLGGAAWWFYEREQHQQTATANQNLELALQETSSLLREAEQAGPKASDRWSQVLATASSVDLLLTSRRIDDDLRRRTESLLATARTAAAKAEAFAKREQRDLHMVAELERIRLPEDQGRRDAQFIRREAEQRTKAYHQAFANHGIDVASLNDQQVVDIIAASSIVVELAGALEHWAGDCRTLKQAADQGNRLMRIAMQADPDPWRKKMRALRLRSHTPMQEIRALARSADPAQMSPVSLVSFTGALHGMGDREEALELLRRGRLAHPQDFYLHLIFGLALEKQKPPQWQEAAQVYSAAIALRPDNWHIAHRLGIALLNLGQHAAAEKVLLDVLRHRPTFARAAASLCEMERQRGNVDQAIAYGQQAVKNNPKLAFAHSNLAAALATQRRWQEARTSAREAIRLQPTLATPHMTLAWICFATDDNEGAIRNALRASTLRRGYTRAFQTLGAAYERIGETNKAVRALRKAVTSNPRSVAVHSSLASLLVRLKNYRGAVDSARQAAWLQPENPNHHMVLGVLLFRLNQHEEGIECLRQVTRLRPKDDEAWYRLGALLLDRKKATEAVTCFERATVLNPNRKDAYRKLAVALKHLGRDAEAGAAAARGGGR